MTLVVSSIALVLPNRSKRSNTILAIGLLCILSILCNVFYWEEEYDEIKTSSSKVIVATYGVAAVGINIPRIFNLVLIEPGKSFVRVIQSIGRGIRKAEDKDFVQIWDITSTCKYAKRHLTERKKYYREAQYPFTITKVDK